MKKLTQILNESIGRVYHFTGVKNAHEILHSGKFKLSTSEGTDSEKELSGGKSFYLSTTRSLTGSYHKNAEHSRGVMFNINSDHLQNNHKMKPKDYWGNSKTSRGTGLTQNHNEMEERIFSDKQNIPIPKNPSDLIHSIHILHDSEYGNPAVTRSLMIKAKTMNIPVHLYTDHKAWKLQDTRKRVPASDYKKVLQNKPDRLFSSISRRPKYVHPYLELYHTPKGNPLSKDAQSILRSHKYYDYNKEAQTRLSSEIHNYKNHPIMNKLIPLVKKHGGVTGFLDHLLKKHDKEDV